MKSGFSARHLADMINTMMQPEPDRTRLLQYLIEIQQRFHHVPAEAIDLLQQRLGISHAQIESVISFYSFLSFDKTGDYHVLFSDNITDRMAGSQNLHQRLSKALKGQAHVSIGVTSCTGLCDQGPGLLVNGHAVSRLDESRIDKIVKLIEKKKPLEEWPRSWFKVDDHIRRRDRQFSFRAGNGDSLSQAIQLGAEQTLKRLEASGLRGRGGAGFRTALKWRLCAEADGDQHYVVCNADEGEPGTFKDRVLLNSYAHSVIEGMTICAWVTGSSQGFIYLRGEYLFLRDYLQEVLAQRRADGLLGRSILDNKGFDFDIDIHLGAGAYICGEESALIESLEGKRGVPRIRPPFPVVKGYKDLPTVVNNVETFWSVSRILLKGSDWFREVGTEQSTGTRLLSISGDCEFPGIYEYPFGVSVKQVLADCGGANAQAVQMAGAAGTTVLSPDFERRISYEDLSTGGSFMVIGPQRNLLDMLENFADFFRHESCGFCTPCRVGTTLIQELIRKFKQGQGSRADLLQLDAITHLMRDTSFCGLGTSAPTAFIDALQHNRELFESTITLDDSSPNFDLQQAVSEFRQILNEQETRG